MEIAPGKVVHPDLGVPEHGFFVEVDHLSWHGGHLEGAYDRRRDLKVRARTGFHVERVTDIAIDHHLDETIEDLWRSGTTLGQDGERASVVAHLGGGGHRDRRRDRARARDGSDAEPLPPDVGVVERVIDGDTVDIDIGGREERVRMIGIDTPELHTDAGGAECMAREALEFTASPAPAGTEVRLERDVVGRDDYGRLLAYVYRRADDVLVNELIVAGGYARPLDDRPQRHVQRALRRRGTAAEAADLGLWRACAG